MIPLTVPPDAKLGACHRHGFSHPADGGAMVLTPPAEVGLKEVARLFTQGLEAWNHHLLEVRRHGVVGSALEDQPLARRVYVRPLFLPVFTR